MNRKDLALISFMTLGLFSSPAYACEPSNFQLAITIGGLGALMATLYTFVSALALACLRNRWLNGSWIRWFKQSMFSFVLAGLGLGLGSLAGLMLSDLRDLHWIAGKYHVYAYFAVLGTTPLLLLASQFLWLKIKAERPQLSLGNGKFLALSYLATLALLFIAAYARQQTLSQSVMIAAVTYALASPLALACLRKRWLHGSWMCWMKQSMLSIVLAALGFGVAYLLMGIELNLRKDLYPYGSATALFAMPLVFLTSQFVWLKIRAERPH